MQLSFAVLQLLNGLFEPGATRLRPPSDLETRELVRKLGAEFVSERAALAIENTTPTRKTNTSARAARDGADAPDRRPFALDRNAFRKSRLQYLRKKIDHCRGKTLDAREMAYFSACALAFVLLAAGDYQKAMFSLASAGWEMSDPEGARLREIIALMRASN